MPRMTARELRQYEANIDTAIPTIQQTSQALQYCIDPVSTPSTPLENESPGVTQELNAGASPYNPRTTLVPFKIAKPEPSLQDLIGDQQFPRPPARVRPSIQSQHPTCNGSQACLPMGTMRSERKRRLSSVENECISSLSAPETRATTQAGPPILSVLIKKIVAEDLKTPFSTPKAIDMKDKSHQKG